MQKMNNKFNIEEEVEVTVKCWEDNTECEGKRKGNVKKI